MLHLDEEHCIRLGSLEKPNKENTIRDIYWIDSAIEMSVILSSHWKELCFQSMKRDISTVPTHRRNLESLRY